MTTLLNTGNREKILFHGLSDRFRSFINATDENIHIIAPYVRLNGLQFLIQSIRNKHVTVITTWKVRDIIKGISDLDIYPFLSERGWDLFIRNDLHAKCLIAGMRKGIITSANITGRGLGILPEPNIECAVRIDDLPSSVEAWVGNLIQDSVSVTRSIYDECRIHLEHQPNMPEMEVKEFVFLSPERPSLSLSSLPLCGSPELLLRMIAELHKDNRRQEPEIQEALHDIEIFGIDISLPLEMQRKALKEAFFSHPFISKFQGFIGDGKYFGESKRWLQSACSDNPGPYRNQLTKYIRVLFDWIEDLSDGRYIKTRFHYSEKLVRVG